MDKQASATALWGVLGPSLPTPIHQSTPKQRGYSQVAATGDIFHVALPITGKTFALEVKSIKPPTSRAPKRAKRGGGGNINVIRSLVIAATLAAPALAEAQSDYLKQQICILVGFPVGGSTDVHARVLAQERRKTPGQDFIIINKVDTACHAGRGGGDQGD